MSVGTVNLEHGMPTAKAALQHLDGELAGAKMRGVKALRVIHGYGSSGKGGKIRRAVRNALLDYQRKGLISDWVAGDEYDEFNVKAHEIRRRFPILEQSFKDDRGNPGITLLIL